MSKEAPENFLTVPENVIHNAVDSLTSEANPGGGESDHYVDPTKVGQSDFFDSSSCLQALRENCHFQHMNKIKQPICHGCVFNGKTAEYIKEVMEKKLKTLVHIERIQAEDEFHSRFKFATATHGTLIFTQGGYRVFKNPIGDGRNIPFWGHYNIHSSPFSYHPELISVS